MLLPLTRDMDVLGGEGQQRIELSCLHRSAAGSGAAKECSMALGVVSFSTSLPCLCSGDSINSEVERGWKEGIFQLAVHSAKRKVLDHLPFMLGWCLVLQSESESESSSEGETRNKSENANWKSPQLWLWLGQRLCWQGVPRRTQRAGNEHLCERTALAEVVAPEMVFEGAGRCCWEALLASLLLWALLCAQQPCTSGMLSNPSRPTELHPSGPVWTRAGAAGLSPPCMATNTHTKLCDCTSVSFCICASISRGIRSNLYPNSAPLPPDHLLRAVQVLAFTVYFLFFWLFFSFLSFQSKAWKNT